MYLVLVDDLEFRDLQQIVPIQPGTRLVFLRLTFFAGA